MSLKRCVCSPRSDECLWVLFSFWFNKGQHGSAGTKWLSENIPVRFSFCNISWLIAHKVFFHVIRPFALQWKKTVKGIIRFDCHVWLVSYFQAQEIDPEGLQTILVQVPRHRHLLLQEQRGERRRTHPTDPPQRYGEHGHLLWKAENIFPVIYVIKAASHLKGHTGCMIHRLYAGRVNHQIKT